LGWLDDSFGMAFPDFLGKPQFRSLFSCDAGHRPSGGETPPEKRKVDSSILSLTTPPGRTFQSPHLR
jgi:hypothetical protein